MVDLQKTAFNPEEDYGTYGTPDPLPIGDYKVMIVDSDMKETKSGTGEYLKLVFEVIEGEYKGRKLFENLNLVNDNPIAVRIANAELKSICVACGGLKPQNSEQLHHIPIIAKVGVRKREDTGDMQNNIKQFKPVSEATMVQVPTSTGASEEKPREAPWKKK